MKELPPKLQLFLDFLMLTVGAAIAAFAIEEFLVPCTNLRWRCHRYRASW